jgi:hypothetical protein
VRRLEQLAEREAATVDPALRGGDAQVEGGSNLLVREPRDITQDDGLPVLEGQLGERREDAGAEIMRLGNHLGKNVC